MYLELNREELGECIQLIESRVRELHPEIRHCSERRYADELRQELELCMRLLHRLHEAECDVSA